MFTNMKLLIPIACFSSALLAQTATFEKQTTLEESDKGQTRVETIEQKIESPSDASTTSVYDTVLSSTVKSAIAMEESLAPFAISVNAKDKMITLQGQVDTLGQLELAVMTAASVKGVENVLSDGLSLKGEAIPPPSVIITGNVKGALVREGIMTREEAIVLPLQVEVNQGVISVSGSLGSEDVKTFVLKSIDTTTEGNSVTSKITVINEPQP